MKEPSYLWYIAFLFLLPFYVSAQNDYEQERLVRKKNQISQILTYQYDLATGDSVLTNNNHYDNNGNLIKRFAYDHTGTLQFSSTIAYNNKGLMIEDKGYDGKGRYLQKYVYAYDSSGNCTDYQQFSADGRLLVHQKSKYNVRNQKTEMYTKLSRQTLFSLSVINHYDARHQLINEFLYDESGELMTETIYEYDKSGRKTTDYRVSNGNKFLSSRFFYDEHGRLVKIQGYRRATTLSPTSTDLYETVSRTEYRYDKADNKIEETTWNQQSLLSKTRFYFRQR